ncbi:MAG: crossover junction endodeoxyribonuclease RuvC [Acidiferrobacteraceae bacterium]
MMRVLGIDPGSRITGFGVVSVEGSVPVYVASGCIRAGHGVFLDRLRTIYDGVIEVIGLYSPSMVAVEKVFFAKNADSALKLGQARGAALCAALKFALPISEYSALQIKQAIVGRGHAQKPQVQAMVRALLHLDANPQADAADALACALCHAHRLGPSFEGQA